MTHVVADDQTWERTAGGGRVRAPAGEIHLVESGSSTRTLCGLPAPEFPFVFVDRRLLPITGQQCRGACWNYTVKYA